MRRLGYTHSSTVGRIHNPTLGIAFRSRNLFSTAHGFSFTPRPVFGLTPRPIFGLTPRPVFGLISSSALATNPSMKLNTMVNRLNQYQSVALDDDYKDGGKKPIITRFNLDDVREENWINGCVNTPDCRTKPSKIMSNSLRQRGFLEFNGVDEFLQIPQQPIKSISYVYMKYIETLSYQYRGVGYKFQTYFNNYPKFPNVHTLFIDDCSLSFLLFYVNSINFPRVENIILDTLHPFTVIHSFGCGISSKSINFFVNGKKLEQENGRDDIIEISADDFRDTIEYLKCELIREN